MSIQNPHFRNVSVATVATFIGFMGFTLVAPFLPLFLSELGLRDVGEIAMWSGLSLGITPAMTALLAPLWGRFADRYGFKMLVQRAIVSFVIVMTALAFVTAPWQVFALRAVQGFFAGYGSLTLAMAANSVPKEHLPYAIGHVQTAQRLGPAVGPLLGGILAPLVGLRNVFLVSACLYIVAFIVVMVFYREPEHRELKAAADGTRVTFRNVLAFRNFVLLMGLLLGMQFVDRSLAPVLPLFVADLHVAPDQVPLIAGILFSLSAAAAAGGNQMSAYMQRRLRARALLAGTSIFASANAIVMAASTSVWPLVFAVPLFGLAIGTALTAAYTMAGSVVPPGAHGVSFGFLTSASLIGFAVSPVVSGLMAGSSLRLVFALDAAILTAIALAVWRMMSDGEGEESSSEPTGTIAAAE